jgi:hypothetical protein
MTTWSSMAAGAGSGGITPTCAGDALAAADFTAAEADDGGAAPATSTEVTAQSEPIRKGNALRGPRDNADLLITPVKFNRNHFAGVYGGNQPVKPYQLSRIG